MTTSSHEAGFELSSTKLRNLRYGIMAFCFLATLVLSVLGADLVGAPRELMVFWTCLLYGFVFISESLQWEVLSLKDLNRLNVMLKDLPEVARCIALELQAGKVLRRNDFRSVQGLHSEFLRQKAETELLDLAKVSNSKGDAV